MMLRVFTVLPMLVLSACDLSLGDDTEAPEFCIKVFAEGTTPPASCNGRPASDSFTPTVSMTLKQGTSKVVLLQTSLIDGPQGTAMLTAPSQPGGGLTITAPTHQIAIPGALAITAAATATAATTGYLIKWRVGDGDVAQEFVMSVLVTQ